MSEDLRATGAEALAQTMKGKIPEASAPTRKEVTPEEAERIRAAKKARYAQVLSRGILNEKFQNTYDRSVPDGFVGKFVRDTEGDIIRYSNLGYGFTYRKGAQGLNTGADNRVRVGDVVLMTIAKEDLEIIREIKAERVQYKVGQQGRQEYMREAVRAAEDGGIVPFDESNTIISRE